MQSQPPVERNTIRMFQTHNAAGQPAPAEFTQVVYHWTINVTLASDALFFLAPLQPRRTPQPGVFTYHDPTRGSGWLRLEEFAHSDAQRIQELVHMEEIRTAVGPEPYRNADIRFAKSQTVRSNNPWVMITYGIALLILGVWVALSTAGSGFGTGPTIIILAMAGLIFVAAIAIVVRSGMRLPWWNKARRYAREHGGVLPPDLSGL